MAERDLYEVLGRHARRVRRGAEARLPQEGPRAAPRHEPRRPRSRGRVQAGDRRLRGAVGPRTPPPVRPVRAAGAHGRPGRPGVADLRRGRPRRPVRGVLRRDGRDAARAGGPEARARRRGQPAPHAWPRRRSAPRASFEVRLPVACEACGATGAAPGTTAVALRGLPGYGRAAPGAPVDPRPDGDVVAVPALPGDGDHDRVARARRAGARGARPPRRRSPSTCPPASRTAPRCGSRAGGPQGSAAGQRDPVRAPRRRARRALRAPRRRPAHRRHRLARPGCARRDRPDRDARGRRDDRRRARDPARRGAAAAPARGDAPARPRPRRPARARRRRGAHRARRGVRDACCARLAEHRNEEVAEPHTGLFSRLRSRR